MEGMATALKVSSLLSRIRTKVSTRLKRGYLKSKQQSTDTILMRQNTSSQAFTPRTGLRTGVSSFGNDGRPMTSVRAAGYSSRGRPGNSAGKAFDPFNQGVRTQEKEKEESPEEVIKDLETKVTKLIEDSTFAAEEGNYQRALEKAKEAGKKERQLSKQREQFNLGDQLNLDLTYYVLLNLATQYHNNHMYQEALNSYGVIVKNKLFNQSGRMRVNMGNIYFEQGKYSHAIKMYRMALDQIPSANRDFRLHIMRNIGNAFVRMGQYQDSITSFEAIMEGNPDHHTGFNLLLCYFATGDREKMKRGFQKLISIAMPSVEQNEDGGRALKDEPIEDHVVFDEDSLRQIARERKTAANRYILMAAKLIAPSIEADFTTGYDWMIDCLKNSANSHMASELEIAKSLQYLKTKDFHMAIECLKSFEKKDQKLIGTAATNLSFLYFLEGDYANSEHYADVAIDHDRYNSKAQTNKGNIYYIRGQLTKARDHYQEVISLDASCTEAMFNLALTLKQLNQTDKALHWFEKLYSILRSNPEVIFQIADIYSLQGKFQQAMEWYNILISLTPTDPEVLARIANIFENDGDKTQAFHYYSESYRYYPSNLEVVGWLGGYYVECEAYEQALQFFTRAAMIQPTEVKWQLMAASCHRRSGNYQIAFDLYKRIHEKFPNNVECLKFLVSLCAELGMKELDQYKLELSRLDGENLVSSTDQLAKDYVPTSLPQSIHLKVLQTVAPTKGPEPDLYFQENVADYLPE